LQPLGRINLVIIRLIGVGLKAVGEGQPCLDINLVPIFSIIGGTVKVIITIILLIPSISFTFLVPPVQVVTGITRSVVKSMPQIFIDRIRVSLTITVSSSILTD
jgi:hypothetical protein